MFIQYLSYNNKTVFYIEYALYKLHKTKITFENHCSIDVKIFWSIFNYLKFDTMTYFIKYIWDYKNEINYDTAPNKAAYKYLLKVFYK